MRFKTYGFTSALLVLLGPLSAGAAKTGGLSADEIKSIAPLFDRHDVVALAETSQEGALESMTVAVRIDAPREVAFKVFEKPENFYYISTLFKENKVLQKHDNSKAYSWASRHKWFSFVGTNAITLYPPRRIDVSIVKSSVGSGNFSMVFHEAGKDRTILVLSGVLDVQSSEWLIRYLVGVNQAMKSAMNLAIGIVIIKGVKAMAENSAAGKPLQKHKARGKRRGPLQPLSKNDLAAIKPLLDRGQVVLTDSVPRGRLSQATVVDKVNAPSAKFLVAAATPEFYPKMIKAISEVTVHQRAEQSVEFSWNIGLSIMGLASRNRLTFAPDGVIVEGLDGNLAGALWRWQIAQSDPGSCVVAYHGWANMDTAGYILEKSVKREPYLEHGFVAGSNMVMLRALKRVVEGK